MRTEHIPPILKCVDPVAKRRADPAWTVAMENFEAARADEVAYDQTTWMPAYHASQNGDQNIPDHVDSKMESLTDVRCDAEDKLIATPASDLSGVIWKIEYARKRWEEFEDWPEDWWISIMSDLGRFALEGRTGA